MTNVLLKTIHIGQRMPRMAFWFGHQVGRFFRFSTTFAPTIRWSLPEKNLFNTDTSLTVFLLSVIMLSISFLFDHLDFYCFILDPLFCRKTEIGCFVRGIWVAFRHIISALRTETSELLDFNPTFALKSPDRNVNHQNYAQKIGEWNPISNFIQKRNGNIWVVSVYRVIHCGWYLRRSRKTGRIIVLKIWWSTEAVMFYRS